MKNLILDTQKLRKFSDEKPCKETLWESGDSRLNIISLRPGQEIKPHVHNGDHIWIVLEGSGEFLSSGGRAEAINAGKVVIAPAGEEHGVRNTSGDGLVFASITL